MKKHFLIAIMTLFSLHTFAQEKKENMRGSWEIDLRPSPKANEYLQLFKVTEIKDKTFQGFFYGSKIKGARINTQWKRLYFAFSTSDNSYEYYHSGYILDGRIYGISYCPDRNLTAPWKGHKKD